MPYVKVSDFKNLIDVRDVLKILQEHPRSDNYSVGGRLMSANYVVANKIKKLAEAEIK